MFSSSAFWVIGVAHVLGIAGAAMLGQRSIRRGLAVGALAPAVAALWAIGRLLQDDAANDPIVSELTWVSGLDLSLRFQLDALATMMTVLVSGIGAMVFVYAIGYFGPKAKGGGRFSASLLAFSTSMLGLVWADSVWTLFIFWELTSVTSFLLVGHKNTDGAVLAAARRALMITGGGGLALLAGLLVLARESGTTVLSDLGPVAGTPAVWAAVLILLGAATKSAQLPFHVWLPGAMAAPTPVSAYLHSATMVKAGVLLVAVVGSSFADVTTWKALGMAFGTASMIWGAVGALRHRDAKLILAWGTISQLGLLITLLSIGTGKAIFAGISLLFAHALFKAALFLVVGEIDIRTGTREIDELHGLARSMPITFGVAVLAGLSMAGVPPLLGFTAKEAAIEAVLGTSGWERWPALIGVIGGAVLTVAYTLRFLLTVFGSTPAPHADLRDDDAPAVADTRVAPRRLAMTVPAVILSGLGLLGYIFIGAVNSIVGPAATELNEKSSVYELIAWPGIKLAFVISMLVVASGAVLGVLASRHTQAAPQPLGADGADRFLDGTLRMARHITYRVQHGSLPVYVATMGATAALAASPFLFALEADHLVLWDTPIQAVLALGVIGAAIMGAFVNSRLGAALTLGAVGLGVSGLFVVHGAPDLVLTQLLVETIVVVGFVVGLGHLGQRFPRSSNIWRNVRLGVAALGGIAVMAALAAASANPSGQPPIADVTEAAVEIGGGNNVVNVVLTDVRGLDTLGEVVVLATVALGILALANARVSGPSDTSGGSAESNGVASDPKGVTT